MRAYLAELSDVLLRPWRLEGTAESKRVVLVAALHVAVAASLCTVLSNWTYLAIKGFLLGWGEMDLGEDDLPPDTVGQVALGLTLSTVIWGLLLALFLGACVLAASQLYGQDRRGFQRAVRRGLMATAWFVVWAALMFAAQTVRPGNVVIPRRWPEGLTFEARPRLFFLSAAFPFLWSLGLRPPSGETVRLSRPTFVVACAAACWLLFWVLWRSLPWIAIEAYTG